MLQDSLATVRHATADDATLLAEIGRTAFSETFAAVNSPENMAAYLAANFSPAHQAAELADPAATFLVAEVEGLAAGYAKLRGSVPEPGVRGSNPVELVRLYVLRSWLGHGVGARLMQTCLEEARQGSHATIWLGVWEKNERAQAFYRRWGFVAVGEHLFHLGSDPQRDILMERAV